jgi:hypothetical protein
VGILRARDPVPLFALNFRGESMRLTITAVIPVLFFTAVSQAKPAPVYLDSLPTSKRIHLLLSMDSIPNCDTDSRVKKIFQDTIPAKKRSDDTYFPDLKADGFAVEQITYLNRSGDSLFFMATVRQDSIGQFYTSLCIDRKDVIRFSVEDNDSPDDESPKPKSMGHRGGGRHGGMGMSGMQ